MFLLCFFRAPFVFLLLFFFIPSLFLFVRFLFLLYFIYLTSSFIPLFVLIIFHLFPHPFHCLFLYMIFVVKRPFALNYDTDCFALRALLDKAGDARKKEDEKRGAKKRGQKTLNRSMFFAPSGGSQKDVSERSLSSFSTHPTLLTHASISSFVFGSSECRV